LDDAQAYYRSPHELARKCLDFVFKMKHYKDDKGETLDRTRVQPKGPELFNTIRHKGAQICSQPTYFDCQPTDQIDDPMAADDARRVLESIVHDPLKRYRPCVRRMVYGALVANVWYMKVEWCDSIGPFGDLRFSADRNTSPMHILVAPGWQDMHDPLCPYIVEWADLPIDSVRGKQGWKDTENLWPDNAGKYRSEEDFSRSSHNSPDQDKEPDTVRVIKVWFRADASTKPPETRSHKPLEPDQQYMYCPDCGYKTLDVSREADGSLPSEGGMCPVCYEGAEPKFVTLQKAVSERVSDTYLKYPNGRLLIVAPHQRRKFYDDRWPEKTRSFPFFQFRAYEDPEEYNGLSDAVLHGNNQVILNSLRRMGYEQMRTSKSIVIIAGGADGKGLLDSRGRPYIMSDENGCVAYAQGPTVSGMVQHVQGQGLPAQWTPYYNAILASFQATQGTSDLGLTPTASKDIAASTVEQLTALGEIPVADHRDVFNEEAGVFLGCALDIWVERATTARAMRYLGPDGAMVVRRLKGADIPNVDVLVTAQPQLRASHAEQFRTFVQWATLTPPLRRLAAKRLNMSISEVQEYEVQERLFMQAQAQLPPKPNGTSNGPLSPANQMAGMGAPTAPAA
jgi:hypothetical protein